MEVPNTVLLSAAEVDIQAAGSSPSVSIVAYTGGVMSVPGWGPVAIDLAGLDAGGDQVGLLADHDATLGGIVGHGRAAVADETKTGVVVLYGDLQAVLASTRVSRGDLRPSDGTEPNGKGCEFTTPSYRGSKQTDRPFPTGPSGVRFPTGEPHS